MEPIWASVEFFSDRYQFSKSFLYKLVTQGKIPRPAKFGKSSRWRVADMDAAFEAMAQKQEDEK